MSDFKSLGIDPPVLKIIEKLGFSVPTTVQEETIPLGLRGKDIVAMSATGSGKTLAFATILIHNIDREKGVQAIILTPTRELTEQVAKVVKVFAKSKRLELAEIFGGVSITQQFRKLKNANIVVGTPGRVLDHLGRGTLKLNNVKLFVLDEADRMFDMGFIRDVERIMSYCPKYKQTLLFSASINDRVLGLADKHLRDFVSVDAGGFVDPKKLDQSFFCVDASKKVSLLVHLIKKEKDGLAMVFCNSRDTVDFVTRNLVANGVSARALHGGLPQSKRSKVVADFHSNSVNVLVCTDVAARGLDINGVEHIYNFNIPRDSGEYVHRIGRTARAGKEGRAINLLCEGEHDDFRKVLRRLDVEIREEQTPKFKTLQIKKGRPPREQKRSFPRRKKKYTRRR